MNARIALWSFLVGLPLLGLWILLWQPALDIHWEHHPLHFWLVLGAALVTGSLPSLQVSQRTVGAMLVSS